MPPLTLFPLQHLDLFPAHIHPPEHAPTKHKKRTRTHRSQSTPTVLSAPALPSSPSLPPPQAVLASGFCDPPTATQAPPRPLPAIPSATPTATTTTPAAVLSTPDFGSFTSISREGEVRPSTTMRPVPMHAASERLPSRYEEKNQAAGASSAARFAARGARTVTRVESESALDRLEMPTTLTGVVRAVVATGATGAGGAAVSPSHAAASASQNRPAYFALADEEPTESKEASLVNWSTLFSALPGAPEERSARKPKAVEPVATGQTSFSTVPSSAAASPSHLRRLLPRRNTNPFLNEAFMSSLPPAKTPPLSPSSRFAKSSPGNPFARLYQAEADDDEVVLDAPATPTDGSRLARWNPFLAEQDNVLQSSPPTSPDEGLGFSKEQPTKATRGVRFDPEAALKASDNPRCPTCHCVFADLDSVLVHLDQSDCSLYDLTDNHTIHAHPVAI